MGTPPEDLTEDEQDGLLDVGGVGVLSFSTESDEPPHAVPVSYGYDAVESVFYFRLAVGPESGKGPIEDRPVSFVTHGTDDDAHWSIVARGRLVRTDEDSVSTESLEGLERVDIPLYDAFDAPIEEVTFAFARLDPDELTGLRTN
jgi:nitroimidazol reductase NimA-like FMN-containing flavoprotein (pyridoxamine 5'-phosphate oxidase superfamily)